jgi:hypothetical protein
VTTTRSGEHRIRDDLGVEFIFDEVNKSLSVNWIPRLPSKLTRVELDLYRRARNAFLQQLATQLGGSVVVIE